MQINFKMVLTFETRNVFHQRIFYTKGIKQKSRFCEENVISQKVKTRVKPHLKTSYFRWDSNIGRNQQYKQHRSTLSKQRLGRTFRSLSTVVKLQAHMHKKPNCTPPHANTSSKYIVFDPFMLFLIFKILVYYQYLELNYIPNNLMSSTLMSFNILEILDSYHFWDLSP